LRKLTPWHHNAAYLIAAGLNNTEVAEEIGGHPAYLGRLVNYSQLFQVILYFYRDEINEKRQAETLASARPRQRQTGKGAKRGGIFQVKG
jgi:hypothetical protein